MHFLHRSHIDSNAVSLDLIFIISVDVQRRVWSIQQYDILRRGSLIKDLCLDSKQICIWASTIQPWACWLESGLIRTISTFVVTILASWVDFRRKSCSMLVLFVTEHVLVFVEYAVAFARAVATIRISAWLVNSFDTHYRALMLLSRGGTLAFRLIWWSYPICVYSIVYLRFLQCVALPDQLSQLILLLFESRSIDLLLRLV